MVNPPLGILFFIVAIRIFGKKGQIIEKIIENLEALRPNAQLPLKTVNQAIAIPASTDAQSSVLSASPLSLAGLDGLFSGLANAFQSVRNERKLVKGKKYLQIALNGSLSEAMAVIRSLPQSDRLIIEAGTPLIKAEGMRALRYIRSARPAAYIVADMKCADLAEREVEMCARAGANALTCLGSAPIEVITAFIAACGRHGVEAMIDMMNVPSAILVLRKLKEMPRVVILHRGVDETDSSTGKQLPFYQIKQVKGTSKCLVAVAGGDTAREVQSAVFNDADIVVVWKDFLKAGETTTEVVSAFLKEVR
jgi:3-keto-L-gulonate-6-phosphate decarboxylase